MSGETHNNDVLALFLFKVRFWMIPKSSMFDGDSNDVNKTTIIIIIIIIITST